MALKLGGSTLFESICLSGHWDRFWCLAHTKHQPFTGWELALSAVTTPHLGAKWADYCLYKAITSKDDCGQVAREVSICKHQVHITCVGFQMACLGLRSTYLSLPSASLILVMRKSIALQQRSWRKFDLSRRSSPCRPGHLNCSSTNAIAN